MKKTGFYLEGLLLAFSIVMTGCQDKGNDQNNSEETTENTGDQSAAQADSGTDFEFEGGNGQNTPMTSEELLNTPVTPAPTGDVLNNIPSNINVTRNTGSTAGQTTNQNSSSNTPANSSTAYTPTTQQAPAGTSARFTISPANAQIFLGTVTTYNVPTANFAATFYEGSGTLEWTSSNPAVAFVDPDDASGSSATVTGLKSGRTYITATLKGTDISATVIVDVYAQTPAMFETDRCQVYKWRGQYSAANCNALISEVNKRRADYNIIGCVKNTGLCMCADTRSAEISFFTSDLRPDLSSYNTVAPAYFEAECIAKVPTNYSMAQIVDQINNHTQSRISDIMNPVYHSLGASYYVSDGWAYVVLAFGY